MYDFGKNPGLIPAACSQRAYCPQMLQTIHQTYPDRKT